MFDCLCYPMEVLLVEVELDSIHSRIPCYIVLDPDQGRYAIRTFDTSGVSFANGSDLLAWIKANWQEDDFIVPNEFRKSIKALTSLSSET